MEPYRHIVQYYETDAMGIAHHSNYIRWMEEARTDLLNRVHLNYSVVEAHNLFSLLVEINSRYKFPTKFEDVVDISISVKELNPVKLILEYEMKVGDKVVFIGTTTQAFVTKEGRPTRANRVFPEFYETLEKIKNNEY